MIIMRKEHELETKDLSEIKLKLIAIEKDINL